MSHIKDILLCDDHPVCLMGIEYVLKGSSFEPFHLRKAVSGREALAEIQTRVPDMLVLDLSLPDFTGVELLKAIREMYRDLKVVILTNSDNPHLLKQALQFRPQAIIQKTHSLENMADVFLMAHEAVKPPYLDPAIQKLLAESVTRPNLT
ncbi:MAG: response regulator transcription factor, partial [Proteobacteria bacterium]